MRMRNLVFYLLEMQRLLREDQTAGAAALINH